MFQETCNATFYLCVIHILLLHSKPDRIYTMSPNSELHIRSVGQSMWRWAWLVSVFQTRRPVVDRSPATTMHALTKSHDNASR